MYRDYSPKGVKFFYIYKALAHPEHSGYIQPFTLEERLMHVKEAQRTLGSDVPWICDTMSNDLKHALGDAPNSEFVIDPEGKVVRVRSWSDPQQLRQDLEELVGPVPNPTRVFDLNLKKLPAPKIAAAGIVPRLERSRAMTALKIEPEIKEGGQPFYAKLRAEADSELLRGGEGKLYVGFHLDPLYHVHWNNLVKPIHLEFKPAGEAKVTPATWDGPELKEPSDIDPREVLVEISTGGAKEPLELTVRYFACNDEQGWCKSIAQTYVIHFEEDRDGGWVQSRGGNRPGGSRPDTAPAADEGKMAQGQLGTIDAEERTITVWTRNAEELTFKLAADATLLRDERPAKLSDIKEGDRCRVEYQPAKEGPPVVRRMMIRSR